MGALTLVCSWGYLLGFALFAPVALPAGGLDRRQLLICHRERAGPWLVANSSFLRSSPFIEAPSLRSIEFGTPLRVVRRWQNSEGKKWLQVQTTSHSFIDCDCDVTRGWMNV